MGTLVLLIVVGLAIGFWLIRRGTAKATAAGNDRDRITVADTAQTRATIEHWAQAHGYHRTGDEALPRYQKGDGVRGQPTFLELRTLDGSLSLESFVGAQTFGRKPAGEMALSAPGLILAIPRKIGKRDHNVLRNELGLPPIA